MYTALKNARIFDDDAWDEENHPKIKTETEDGYLKDSIGPCCSNGQGIQEHMFKKIKEEPEDEERSEGEENYDKTLKLKEETPVKIKNEQLEINIPGQTLKSTKSMIDESPCNKKIFKNLKIKEETPIKMEADQSELSVPRVTLECVQSVFDESPYNKELFKSLKIKEETPVKIENSPPEIGVPRNTLKSVKRAVFSRESPYKLESGPHERRVSAKSRLGSKINSDDEDHGDLYSEIKEESNNDEWSEGEENYDSSFKIKEETPVKMENSRPEIIVPRNTLKSAKMAMLSRHSPYKLDDSDPYKRRVSAKNRLGPKIVSDDEDDILPRLHIKGHVESDPVVLARREKQIEYGKNTIGYENYTKMVPKSARTIDDPKTPPKFMKYSRRGWEGLIKQWRVKLHKYDPPENAS